MSRLLLVALAALVVAIPATAAGSPATQLEGTVGAKLSRGLIRIDARKMSHILRVPGSQSRIHVGQRVELRGALLRQRGNHSRVLARNVALVRSVARSSSRSTHGASGSDDATAEHPNGDDQGNSGPGNADDDDSDDHGPAACADDNDDDPGDDDVADDDDSDHHGSVTCADDDNDGPGDDDGADHDSGDDDSGHSGHGHSDDD